MAKNNEEWLFETYFREEKGQHVCRMPIQTRKALDNRELRTTLTKDRKKYRIHLVDLTANRRKLLAAGAVSTLGELLQAANAFHAVYLKLG